MRSIDSLRQQLQRLDRKDYGAYQSLLGEYSYDRFVLGIDKIPKDPYAPAGTGIFRASVALIDAGIPSEYHDSKIKSTAFRDFLARRFHNACRHFCPGRRGTGNSGIITIAEPGQEILDRTSMQLYDERIEARFSLGLPASGRRINSRIALDMLLWELPRIVESSLFATAFDLDALEAHIHASEDTEELRRQLPDLGLIAFIADGSILPRESGIDPHPLREETVVRFKSPESLKRSVELPHAGTVSGMGIPTGVTLIIGGGYHGKSTLLQAVELGIYNHIPGDGRELCVSEPTAVKVRATSGRSVVKTDLSAFINNLPLNRNTTSFTTRNASGSTSQAAYIVESIEMGAKLLLMDEDTCAANLMIRDGRMQQLVAREQEPITAFVDRVRQLYRELRVSTVLVMGGSGDYFDVADCIIQMAEFTPREVTARAREIADASPSQRKFEGSSGFPRPTDRNPTAEGLEPKNQYGHFRIAATDSHSLIFGRHKIDLSDLEQIVETAQIRAIGNAIEYSKRFMNGRNSLREIVEKVIAEIDRSGIDILDRRLTGDLASFRGIDLASTLNRFRGLTIRQSIGQDSNPANP